MSESLNGTYTVHADGSISGVAMTTSERFHFTVDDLCRWGMTAARYERSLTDYGYKSVAPSMQRTGPSCAEQEEIWALQTAAPAFSEADTGMVQRDMRPAFKSDRTPYDAFPDFLVTSDCAVESQPNGAFRGLRLDAPGRFVAPKAL